MDKRFTADDLLPLIAALPDAERKRLLELLSRQSRSGEAGAYAAAPVGRDEFSTDEEPLAWDNDGWDNNCG